MIEIKATRRSKFGFGYSTSPTGKGSEIEPTTLPCITGTIKQVIMQKEEDRTLHSLGGSFFTTAWFIRKNGKWLRIDMSRWETPCSLVDGFYNDEGAWEYLHSSVTVYAEGA